MVWFFKKKRPGAALEQLAATGLWDFHNHVLHGVDDGARDLEQSVAMVERLGALGYRQLAVSPHFDAQRAQPSVETQRPIIEQIEAALGREFAGPRLRTGAEVIFDDTLVEGWEDGVFPCIGDARDTYLVEFAFGSGRVPRRFEDAAFRMRVKGATLVLAHPERVADFQSDPGLVRVARSAGMLFQLDVMALVGRYGGKARRLAYSLLEKGEYHFACSDIHRPHDLDTLEQALSALADWDMDVACRLVSHSPRDLIEGTFVSEE